MKNHFLYLLAFICISFVACSNDDDDSCSGKTEAISIIVENLPMANITGTASVNGDNISVDIGGDSSNNSKVFFSCPNAIGTYDLNLDFSGQSESQTVTAFVPAETLNVILSSGCFEIVSIDASDVVMRFNVNEGDASINGEIALDVN
ncbi:MAG: hypothetical protein ACI860_001887 [Chitinophagales bacterium]|jgi:hypothetical protein